MTKITIDRTVVEQALEALEDIFGANKVDVGAINALRAALAEPTLQTCNCRWEGEVQVQQCTLHEAHVNAIHEWAERAKTAEKKLSKPVQLREHCLWARNGNEPCPHVQQAQPVQEPAPMPPFPPVSLWKRGCAVCGIGAGGHAYGYACPRSDCPTRVTCGGTV